MTPGEEKAVRRWSDALTADVLLDLIVTEDDRSERLIEFCTRLAELAPQVEIRKQKSETIFLPAVGILPHLRYHGVPRENELEPFLEAVSQAAGDASDPLPEEVDPEQIKLPADLMLFIAPGCPHCPTMVRRLVPLAIASDKVHLSIVDAMGFQEAAAERSIRSVPALLFDGKYRFNGVTPAAEVGRMLLSRDPADLSAAVLLSLIEEGQAGEVTDLVLAHRVVFPALIDLLTDEKWPKRLGAMVALEGAAEVDPQLAAGAVPELARRLDSAPEAVKGDLVYMIGEIGSAGDVPVLEKLSRETASEEIAECVAEALDKLKGR